MNNNFNILDVNIDLLPDTIDKHNDEEIQKFVYLATSIFGPDINSSIQELNNYIEVIQEKRNFNEEEEQQLDVCNEYDLSKKYITTQSEYRNFDQFSCNPIEYDKEIFPFKAIGIKNIPDNFIPDERIFRITSPILLFYEGYIRQDDILYMVFENIYSDNDYKPLLNSQAILEKDPKLITNMLICVAATIEFLYQKHQIICGGISKDKIIYEFKSNRAYLIGWGVLNTDNKTHEDDINDFVELVHSFYPDLDNPTPLRVLSKDISLPNMSKRSKRLLFTSQQEIGIVNETADTKEKSAFYINSDDIYRYEKIEECSFKGNVDESFMPPEESFNIDNEYLVPQSGFTIISGRFYVLTKGKIIENDIKARKNPKIKMLVTYILNFAAALYFLHTNNLWCGDLSESNMVTSKGKYKLFCYGMGDAKPQNNSISHDNKIFGSIVNKYFPKIDAKTPNLIEKILLGKILLVKNESNVIGNYRNEILQNLNLNADQIISDEDNQTETDESDQDIPQIQASINNSPFYIDPSKLYFEYDLGVQNITNNDTHKSHTAFCFKLLTNKDYKPSSDAFDIEAPYLYTQVGFTYYNVFGYVYGKANDVKFSITEIDFQMNSQDEKYSKFLHMASALEYIHNLNLAVGNISLNNFLIDHEKNELNLFGYGMGEANSNQTIEDDNKWFSMQVNKYFPQVSEEESDLPKKLISGEIILVDKLSIDHKKIRKTTLEANPHIKAVVPVKLTDDEIDDDMSYLPDYIKAMDPKTRESYINNQVAMYGGSPREAFEKGQYWQAKCQERTMFLCSAEMPKKDPADPYNLKYKKLNVMPNNQRKHKIIAFQAVTDITCQQMNISFQYLDPPSNFVPSVRMFNLKFSTLASYEGYWYYEGMLFIVGTTSVDPTNAAMDFKFFENYISNDPIGVAKIIIGTAAAIKYLHNKNIALGGFDSEKLLITGKTHEPLLAEYGNEKLWKKTIDDDIPEFIKFAKVYYPKAFKKADKTIIDDLLNGNIVLSNDPSVVEYTKQLKNELETMSDSVDIDSILNDLGMGENEENNSKFYTESSNYNNYDPSQTVSIISSKFSSIVSSYGFEIDAHITYEPPEEAFHIKNTFLQEQTKFTIVDKRCYILGPENKNISYNPILQMGYIDDEMAAKYIFSIASALESIHQLNLYTIDLKEEDLLSGKINGAIRLFGYGMGDMKNGCSLEEDNKKFGKIVHKYYPSISESTPNLSYSILSGLIPLKIEGKQKAFNKVRNEALKLNPHIIQCDPSEAKPPAVLVSPFNDTEDNDENSTEYNDENNTEDNDENNTEDNNEKNIEDDNENNKEDNNEKNIEDDNENNKEDNNEKNIEDDNENNKENNNEKNIEDDTENNKEVNEKSEEVKINNEKGEEGKQPKKHHHHKSSDTNQDDKRKHHHHHHHHHHHKSSDINQEDKRKHHHHSKKKDDKEKPNDDQKYKDKNKPKDGDNSITNIEPKQDGKIESKNKEENKNESPKMKISKSNEESADKRKAHNTNEEDNTKKEGKEKVEKKEKKMSKDRKKDKVKDKAKKKSKSKKEDNDNK